MADATWRAELGTDGVWTLDPDVPMDNVSLLRERVTGRLEKSLETTLRDRSELLDEVGRTLVPVRPARPAAAAPTGHAPTG